MAAPEKSTYRLAVVRPVWLPFNNTAKLIVDGLMLELGYPTTGPKATKYAVVVASVLKAHRLSKAHLGLNSPLT